MKRKIVSESIEDFKNRAIINESFFSNTIGALKNIFKKIGKFFFASFDGKNITSSISPTNIGIMVNDHMINDAISFIPSADDVSLHPALASLSEANILQKRGTHVNESKQTLYEALINRDHPDKNVPNVTGKQLERDIRISIKDPGLSPLMIWGAPALGKTKIVQAVLKARGKGRLIDVQTSKMAPDDWSLPATYKDITGTVKATDIPKSWLPVYTPTGDPKEDARLDDIANFGHGGILFLDELSRASVSVQNTCLKLVDERIIGDAKIGSKWTIISASNREEDEEDSVQNLSNALSTRFTQVNFPGDYEYWKDNFAYANIDPRIIDFLDFNKDLFYTLNDEPGNSIFASPRTWDMASRRLMAITADAEEEGVKVSLADIRHAIGSNVGDDVAIKFNTFLELLKTFTIKDIQQVFTNPMKAKLPRRAGSSYEPSEANAIITILCSSTRQDKKLPVKKWNAYCTYLARLEDKSLATKGLKVMIAIHPYINEQIENPNEIENAKTKYLEGYNIFAEAYGKPIITKNN